MASKGWDYVSGINGYIADLETCVEAQARLLRLLEAADQRTVRGEPSDPMEQKTIRRTRRSIAILTERLALGE
jgi:hypothetical protein